MKKNNRTSSKTLVFMAMMGAVSAILMTLDFSVPLMPAFLKFDISELPALFAGFFLGPVSGCTVELIKVLLKLIAKGTDTAFVGEFANFLGSVCFILPASLIYKWKHTKKGAIISMAVATLIVSFAYVLINAFIALPMYEKFYGMSTEAVVQMSHAVNPLITDKISFLMFSIFPFNIFKHGVTSLITYLVYKRAGNVLRNMIHTDQSDSKK